MTPLLLTLLRSIGCLLYYIGLSHFIVRLRGDDVRVFLYHACAPEEDDFISGLQSNVPPQLFARHMAYVVGHYTVISLAQLETGDLPKCAALITFDDGYRSVFQGALPTLRRLGLPATVYLVADVVGNGRLVWVNELNWLLRRYPIEIRPLVAGSLGLPASTAPESLVAAAGRRFDPRVIAKLLEEARARTGTDPTQLAQSAELYLSWDEVARMREAGITFGNHSASHPSLSCVTEEQAVQEVGVAHACIARAIGTCTSFAYPFGDRSDAARRAATELAYRSIMEVGGYNRPLNRWRVGRVAALAYGPARLFADVELVEPFKAWVRSCLHRHLDRAPAIS